MNPYAEIFSAFQKAKIKYLIVGGVAVNLYGYSRFTADVDILLALDEKNIQKMNSLMEEMGYVPRLPVQLHELRDQKKVQDWIKNKNFKAYTFLSSRGLRLDIDILAEESLKFEELYKDKSRIKIWDIAVPVVSMNYLISMKKKAARDQDLIDLKALLKLKSE